MTGRYQVIRSIARGGMAEVFLARMTGEAGFAKTVALKRLPQAIAADADVIKMLQDEARLAARLNHPQVVQVFDFGRDQEGYYIAMEYVEGPDLNTVLKFYRERGELPPLPPLVSAMIQALRGLDYAHRLADESGVPLGVVHRDVSPSNVLVTAEGVAKVSDFGIAKAHGRATETRVGSIKGKLPYMSPEQARGRAVDARTDVFSAGLVLWECVAGRRCYDAVADNEILRKAAYAEHPTFAEVGVEVDAQLQDIVERAIRADPLERFQTAGEMALALEDFQRRANPHFHPEDLGDMVLQVLGKPRPASGAFPVPPKGPSLLDALNDPTGTGDTFMRPLTGDQPVVSKSRGKAPEASPRTQADVGTDWGLGGVASKALPAPQAEPEATPISTDDVSTAGRRAKKRAADAPAESAPLRRPGVTARPAAKPARPEPTELVMGGPTQRQLDAVPAAPFEGEGEGEAPPPPAPPREGASQPPPGGFGPGKAAALVVLTLGVGAGVFAGISYVERPAPGEDDLTRKPPPMAPLHANAAAAVSGHPVLKTFLEPDADAGPAAAPDPTVAGGANPTAEGANANGGKKGKKGKKNKEGAEAPTTTGGEGTLDIACNPSCDVFVDGSLISAAPVTSLSLPAGTHTVKAKNVTLNVEKTAKVTVGANERVFKNFNMVGR